ncbi:MAG TPA: hypothetical protein VL360_08445 [Gammaproteobacteria bacterium]|jgi:hypothetical protein|nr:hypothetical protein [Gammaproteobacteria bacterium]
MQPRNAPIGEENIEALEGLEVIDASGLQSDEFVEIDLGDAVRIGPDAEIQCATDAFKACIHDTLQKSLNAEYAPARSVPKGVVHGLFCEQGSFSFKKTAINAASAALGGAASLFALTPARNAVIYMTRIITQLSSGTASDYFPGQESVVVLAQFMNMTRTVVIISIFANGIFHSFLVKASNAENYLKTETPTAPGKVRLPKTIFEKIKRNATIGGRKTFDLISAVAGNLPIIFTLWSESQVKAILAFLSIMPIGIIGMGGVKFERDHTYLPQKLEADYMRQQLAVFLMLPREKQNKIMEKIKAILDSDHSNKEKVIFNLMVNLCKPEDIIQDEETIEIMRKHPEKTAEIIFSHATGILGGFSQLSFMESSGVGVANLFSNPTSPGAIATGVIAAITSFLPTVFFGYRGGRRAGMQLLSKTPTLAEVINPELRAGLKSFIHGLNILSGGILINFAYKAAKDFSNLLKLQAEAEAILAASFVGVSYIGSTIAIAQYCLDAIDEIVLFLARNTSDEESQRLINFVNSYIQMIKILESMNTENYVDITANWKMLGGSELSKTLHAIYSNELSDQQYHDLQMRLREAYELAKGLKNTNAVILPDRLSDDSYVVSESFLDRHQHLGLRRRHPVQNSDYENDIEMQFANGHKL